MSESARALCQIIERRPFIALSDDELKMIVFALTGEATRSPFGDLYRDLTRVAWDELKTRGLGHQVMAQWEQCDSFITSHLMNTPIQCQDKQGHDGKHYNGPKYARQEWE